MVPEFELLTLDSRLLGTGWEDCGVGSRMPLSHMWSGSISILNGPAVLNNFVHSIVDHNNGPSLIEREEFPLVNMPTNYRRYYYQYQDQS